jgi:hypothetical protein
VKELYIIWISQGYLNRYFKLGYLLDILKSEKPEWDIPNQWEKKPIIRKSGIGSIWMIGIMILK